MSMHILATGLFLVALLLGFTLQATYNERDTAQAALKRVSSALADKFAIEYAKGICGVTLYWPQATNMTDKEEACVVGIRAKAKADVEAVAERR